MDIYDEEYCKTPPHDLSLFGLSCVGPKFSADGVVGAGRSKFVVREEMLPDFIGHMRSQIFNAGKFLTVLRSCELPIEAMLRDADGQQVRRDHHSELGCCCDNLSINSDGC